MTRICMVSISGERWSIGVWIRSKWSRCWWYSRSQIQNCQSSQRIAARSFQGKEGETKIINFMSSYVSCIFQSNKTSQPLNKQYDYWIKRLCRYLLCADLMTWTDWLSHKHKNIHVPRLVIISPQRQWAGILECYERLDIFALVICLAKDIIKCYSRYVV